MKTVAIVGSPRKDGNCDILVNKLLEKIDGEKSIYYLNELDIGFCKACQACQKGDCVKDDDARTDNVSAYEATECARAFCQTVESNGYTASIYSPSRELYFKYDLSRLKDYDIWYCEYSDTPEFYYQFSMWQYTTAGTVDGIDGEVDLNICFTGIADYA